MATIEILTRGADTIQIGSSAHISVRSLFPDIILCADARDLRCILSISPREMLNIIDALGIEVVAKEIKQ